MSKETPSAKLCANLFAEFEPQDLFLRYFAMVDLEQDGPYAIFHAFNELFEALLRGTEKDDALLTNLIAFLNCAIAQKDAEIDNLIKMEVFSPLNRSEIAFLQGKLSANGHDMLATLYD